MIAVSQSGARITPLDLNNKNYIKAINSMYNHADDLLDVINRYGELDNDSKDKYKSYYNLIQRRLNITMIYIESIDTIFGG